MQSGQWWWAIVIQAGGVLTSSYVLLVLAHAFARASGPATRLAPIPRISEAAALALGLCSVRLLVLIPIHNGCRWSVRSTDNIRPVLLMF